MICEKNQEKQEEYSPMTTSPHSLSQVKESGVCLQLGFACSATFANLNALVAMIATLALIAMLALIATLALIALIAMLALVAMIALIEYIMFAPMLLYTPVYFANHLFPKYILSYLMP